MIDALPGSSETLSSEDVDERIQKWIDTGLIAGPDRNNAHIKSLERDVEAYETEARADFNYWQGIKDADRTNYTAAQNAVYDKYAKLFGSYSTVESYLAGQAADANSDYAKLKAQAANPLALGALYTPKNATLTANGFIKNTSNKLLAAAYLDVGGKLTLNAGNNDIGTAENPIVIKNGTDSVITTGKKVYLTPTANLTASGMVNLRSGGSIYLDLENNKGYYFPSTYELLGLAY